MMEPRRVDYRRAGWAQITERRDVLAEAVAQVVLHWDGGRQWPAGHVARFDPVSSPAAAEWTEQLRPAPAWPAADRARTKAPGEYRQHRPRRTALRRRLRLLGGPPDRPSRRGHCVRERRAADQHRRPALRGDPGRAHSVGSHRRRGNLAGPRASRSRLVLGVPRRRPGRARGNCSGNLRDDITSPAVSRKTEPDDGS